MNYYCIGVLVNYMHFEKISSFDYEIFQNGGFTYYPQRQCVFWNSLTTLPEFIPYVTEISEFLYFAHTWVSDLPKCIYWLICQFSESHSNVSLYSIWRQWNNTHQVHVTNEMENKWKKNKYHRQIKSSFDFELILSPQFSWKNRVLFFRNFNRDWFKNLIFPRWLWLKNSCIIENYLRIISTKIWIEARW